MMGMALYMGQGQASCIPPRPLKHTTSSPSPPREIRMALWVMNDRQDAKIRFGVARDQCIVTIGL